MNASRETETVCAGCSRRGSVVSEGVRSEVWDLYG